ncbi:tRNA 2'-phosphotransferase 1 [Rhizophlyctis rosea]|nr:tRNA 2'-phosphotransferase 1 [Rhizophlyctis rosea]
MSQLNQPSASSSPAGQPFDFLLVLDFEATCSNTDRSFPNEIIEFPIVVLDTHSLYVVAEFREHIRPTINPTLTHFCIDLTGITQDVVDAAETFPEVFGRVVDFVGELQAAHPGAKLAFVTCGDWDLKTMLPLQLQHSHSSLPATLNPPPPIFSRWINIKVPFHNALGGVQLDASASNKKKKKKSTTRLGMAGMLQRLGLPLVGRHHCRIDDARNIAQIAKALIERGVVLDITSR